MTSNSEYFNRLTRPSLNYQKIRFTKPALFFLIALFLIFLSLITFFLFELFDLSIDQIL